MCHKERPFTRHASQEGCQRGRDPQGEQKAFSMALRFAPAGGWRRLVPAWLGLTWVLSEKRRGEKKAHRGVGWVFCSYCEILIRFKCIDPAVSAQVRRLMQMPQRVFSSSAPDVGAGGCKSQSSLQ